ncbi:sugar phosphate isomerase/epimerase [Aquincola sp. S2]|uniref:Sugar phosphate isomerase/epimerase n=1 Tax=Pseudaquabacterium terrae TaxID=2732868 RepID=A0ABX2EMM8_9BURK|nr:sugar phosphate isomerase/epimerase family protein [Aquabacterium terrae]NRF69888.1 sugar phosphate isomerase/epimerase [Aquabacterium terrae]
MKLALCNEVLRHLSFEQQCARAAALRCDGLELAPFTLAEDPRTLTTDAARRLRDTAAAHGLTISSLHWLLAQPAGWSLSTPDTAQQARTVDFLRHLIDFAAACGAQVLVHGSPAQRAPAPGQSVADALSRCEAAWAALAPHAQAAGITYCIEPLSPAETPVLNTLAEAVALVERIGSPAMKTMLDLSAAAQAEADDAATLLRRHLPSGHIAHVQLNDRNRRGPGQGQTPVAPVLAALRALNYRGWIAIEPFDYQPDAENCAAYSCGYARALLDALEGRS